MSFTTSTRELAERNRTMYQTRSYPVDLQLRRLGAIRRAQRRHQLAARGRLLVGRTLRPRPARAR